MKCAHAEANEEYVLHIHKKIMVVLNKNDTTKK